MINDFHNQILNVTNHYAKLLKIRVTKKTLKRELEENPYYPSLLSIKNTFTKFKIPNEAFEIKTSDIDQFKAPFIVHYNIEEAVNDFVLVTEMNDYNISYIYKNRKEESVTRKEFSERFRNIIFIAEPNEESGEPDYSKKRKEELASNYKKTGLILGGIFLFFIAFFANGNLVAEPSFLVYALLKTAGTIVSVFLLIYGFDSSNPLVKSICEGSVGKPSSCNAVLKSKASKIFGFSWSEIGFFYFSSTLLLLLFPTIQFSDRLIWLSIFTVFTIPFIVFSIYYQGFIFKQWCKLCLITDAILILEFLSSLIFFRSDFHFPQIELLQLSYMGTCILIPILSYYAIKGVIIKALQFKDYKYAYLRMKNHPDYFNYILMKQPQVDEVWNNVGFAIGNPKGTIILTIVSNPFCIPCAAAHSEIENILMMNENIQVRVIFFNQNISSDDSTQISKHILAISAKGDIIVTRQAINDWYLNKNYTKFARKFPISKEDIDKQGIKLDSMNTLCNDAGIQHTPTFFINRYSVPEIYTPEELKTILIHESSWNI